jgi:hypothetical protein
MAWRERCTDRVQDDQPGLLADSRQPTLSDDLSDLRQAELQFGPPPGGRRKDRATRLACAAIPVETHSAKLRNRLPVNPGRDISIGINMPVRANLIVAGRTSPQLPESIIPDLTATDPWSKLAELIG